VVDKSFFRAKKYIDYSLLFEDIISFSKEDVKNSTLLENAEYRISEREGQTLIEFARSGESQGNK
jgi:hypothetical protein